MFSSPHKFHLVAVRKRPAMLESEISKFYPSSRRSCKYNLLDFTYADFHKAFFASHNTNQISLDKIIFLIHRFKAFVLLGTLTYSKFFRECKILLLFYVWIKQVLQKITEFILLLRRHALSSSV